MKHEALIPPSDRCHVNMPDGRMFVPDENPFCYRTENSLKVAHYNVIKKWLRNISPHLRRLHTYFISDVCFPRKIYNAVLCDFCDFFFFFFCKMPHVSGKIILQNVYRLYYRLYRLCAPEFSIKGNLWIKQCCRDIVQQWHKWNEILPLKKTNFPSLFS